MPSLRLSIFINPFFVNCITEDPLTESQNGPIKLLINGLNHQLTMLQVSRNTNVFQYMKMYPENESKSGIENYIESNRPHLVSYPSFNIRKY